MKPRAVLDDMPLHIKEHIVKSVDYETRFSLRKCSKSMCQIVDKSPIHYTTIILHIDKFVAFLTFSHPQKKSDYKIKVDYRKSIDHRKVQVTKWKDEPVKSTLVHGVEFPHLVAQDVWNALKNPNLKSIYHSNQTHELEIRIDDLNFEKVKLFEILGPSRLEHRNLYNTRIFTRGNLKNDMVIQYSEKSLKVNTNSMLKDRRQCYDTFPEELIFKLLCRS
uniref:F-box domain-containing protein n=1 Tax=Caenorhabditis japonica TaxID=281687 RepID=A0A8R1I277_CAEJA